MQAATFITVEKVQIHLFLRGTGKIPGETGCCSLYSKSKATCLEECKCKNKSTTASTEKENVRLVCQHEPQLSNGENW